MNSDRFKRQAKRVIQEKISSTPVTIIGTGAIGREIALKLAQMGTTHLQLVDFDTVEETNICTQGYLEKDLGRPKIEALRDSCIAINSNISISLINQRFSPMNTKLTPVTFSCVDKMKPRTQI